MNIIFDVSDLRNYLKHSEAVTGIQRVVVQAMNDAHSVFSNYELWLGYYDAISEKYLCVNFARDADVGIMQSLRSTLGLHKENDVFTVLGKYRNNRIKRAYHARKLDYHAKRGQNKYFQRLGITIDTWKALRENGKTLSAELEILPIEDIAKEGDKFIILDNIIQSIDGYYLINSNVRDKIEFFTFIHDLIPIVIPKTCHPGNPEKFYTALLRTAEMTDKYLVNSQNTKLDLEKFLSSHNYKTPIVTIPLAQNMNPLLQYGDYPKKFVEIFPNFATTASVRDEVLQISNVDYVLVVGTREIRKNLLRLAKAWRGVVDDLGTETKLVIVGNNGWLNGEFDRFLENTSYLDGAIKIIEGANDFEISLLYSNCLFTACVSIYEGWGLPVGESLSHGKAAVVSNTSSLPEVGDDCVEYCDPLDVNSIKSACIILLTDLEKRSRLEEKISNRTVRMWRDFLNEVEVAILDIEKEC